MSEEIKEEKISIQSAQNELNKMMDYYEIEVDEIEDEELKKAIKQGYERAIKAVRKGRLEIKVENGTIKIIQTMKDGKTKYVYKEIDGEAKMAMAGKKQDDYYGKAYALMGSLSENGENAVKKLKGVDLSLAEVLGMLFLAV
jgi:hypothetical protein